MTEQREAIGRRTLIVSFARLDEKYRGACQYDVLVEGIPIGITLYRDQQSGYVTARNCVGGSAPGYNYWCIYAPDYEAFAEKQDDGTLWATARVPWFSFGDKQWDTLKEAKAGIAKALDKPLDWLDSLGSCALQGETQGITLFLDFLVSRGVS